MLKPIEVAKGIFRGPQPVTTEDFQTLQDMGIKYTLDLETGSHLFSDGSPLDETLFAELFGIRTYSHPLGEILPPSGRELFLAAKFINTHQPVYVHCKAGVDRTGMVIAKWRVSGMMSKKLAKKEMHDMGMHWWYVWWTWFL